MPLVRISLVKGKPQVYRGKIGDAIHRALVETIGVPPLDRFQLFTEHEPGDLI
jgi:4-oxalocrotonate tautomerase